MHLSLPCPEPKSTTSTGPEQQSGLLLQVADFFAQLVKRVSPKSYTQAMAEVTITRRFLENFSGDSVQPRCMR